MGPLTTFGNPPDETVTHRTQGLREPPQKNLFKSTHRVVHHQFFESFCKRQSCSFSSIGGFLECLDVFTIMPYFLLETSDNNSLRPAVKVRQSKPEKQSAAAWKP